MGRKGREAGVCVAGRGSKLWEGAWVFFQSREEGRGWETCILDRSQQRGFGEEELRKGAGSLLEVMMSTRCKVFTMRMRHSL